ncbi:protein bassoon [Platysternon megacephalum]|uniref:Protein bassoon n=1 Tax=Platysternon megacephalum TaxID=55544 RepID=A0A4D9DTR9_9SAUR|nr:protein bassoon [Platysternon megacephalum]
MERVAAAFPRLPLLLLLLVPGALGLRLLLSAPPPFNCSQPDLNCLVRNSTCMDQSWLRVTPWTPSAPSVLDVHPDVFHDEGKLLPVLRIEWKVATDASIQYLQGVELAVLQVNNNQQICAQFDFQNNLPLQVRPDGGRWNFTFNRFEVEPGQMYQVTVHHLPKLGTSGDHNCKSTSYTVPDCRDPVMKRTMTCMQTGSLWEPSIDGKSLDDSSLLVSFNPGMESAQYRIHVTSFPDEEKQCKETTHIYEPLQSGQQHRVNVTVKIEKNLKACCRYKVQIQPFFTICGTDCLRHSAVIPCPSVAPTTYPADDPIMWLYWCITGICILLVGSVIVGAIYMTRRQVGRQRRKYSSHELLPPQLTPPSLRPRKVWIVYSADHPLYVDVVLKFAQFLITVCGTEVVLDLLEKRQISEIGALPWLTRQKKEMEELSSKIIILCSRGTRAKWQAMLGKEGTAVSLKQDQWQPTGDMFTPALNLILPDFKKPACFGMYIVCYFEGISEDKDIPDPFNVTSKYQLMDRFEDIYFLIQDMEKFEPGRIHQIQEITAENYAENSNGWRLKEAVQTFQEWQAKHPDWFERENTCSEDEESLDKEILEEFMPGNGEVIRKQQLHVQEPDPNGCCAVILHVNEDEGGNFKLQLQLNPQGNPASQTLMIPVDEAPPVQMVEPISITGGKNAASHQMLTNTDWMEGIPLLETSVPMRNSIILHDDFDVPSSDNQKSVDHLPNEMRQQLEGLMYSLYQQSVIPSEPSLRQEDAEEQQQQVAFNNPCKDQRQSVQSDQGYISRCSPLPPDDLVEEEEEEDQEQENKMPSQYISPEVLDSLKSLQQKLLFQEIQQKSVWEHMGGMMDTDHCAADS